MPIYEFRCQHCDQVSEFQMRIADPNPSDCPKCKQSGLQKIMSLPSFHLKGGGWYAEAYDGKSNKRAADSKADAASGSPDSGAKGHAASATASEAAPKPAESTPSSGSKKNSE